MNRPPLLQVEGLSKSFYLHEMHQEIHSVDEVSLTAFSGSLTALVGPTGAGKSSVLKAIFRTYLPSNGCINYTTTTGRRIDLAQADDHQIIALRNREIGFVTQFLHAMPRQKTVDVVAAPLCRLGIDRTKARKEAESLLERLKIPQSLWALPPATFSGGERQRVNLARGVISKPRLLLLDEPTASLDPLTIQEVIKLIDELKEAGTAILAIFHDPNLIERLADQVVHLTRPTKE